MQLLRKKKRRLIHWAIGIGAFSIGVLSSYALIQMVIKPPTKPSNQIPVAKQAPSPKKTANSVRLVAMGDILAHDSVVQNARQNGGYDFTKFFRSITPFYQSADVTFCNPETPAGTKLGISGYPTFTAPDEFVRDLRANPGCNLINLATNHINDKGQAGIEETLKLWEATEPLAIAGANRTSQEQSKVKYFNKNGIKFAFVAFADFSNNKNLTSHSVNFYHDSALVKHLMSEARQNSDVVIVSAHWGAEDSTVVNNDQASASNLLADLGADVIIGTGPHVLQKVEWISRGESRTLVWYSIGNLLSSQLLVDELTGGIASMEFEKADGKVVIKNLSFAPTFMAYDWPTGDKASGKLLARTNLNLLPLMEADQRIRSMFSDETAESRMNFVKQTLSSDEVKIIDKTR